MKCYVQVIMSFAKTSEIDRFFTYEVPEALQETIEAGMRVKVPFGKRNHSKVAYVIQVLSEIEATTYEIKPIKGLFEEQPILSKEQMHLVKYMVSYYGTTYAQAIETVLPPGIGEKVLEEEKEKVYHLTQDAKCLQAYIASNQHKQTFKKQQQVIELLKDNPLTLSGLKDKKVSLSSLQTLEKHGIVMACIQAITQDFSPIDPTLFLPLNKEQQQVVETLQHKILENKYEGYLLHGVTGSGKTEVFLHAIKTAIQQDKTVIVLVPEIALTPQTLSRFSQRFGNRVALTHSRMTPQQRQKLYMKAKKGEVGIVIGPRSGVFMPLPRLGMIIVDEAHETTYKSETTPKYHAIDVATERMKQVGGVLLLASATPSLESMYQVEQKTLTRLRLEHRATGAKMPEIELVDMREELRSGNVQVISRGLHESIDATLKAGHQVMLLINRRGHSTFVNCRNCGYVVKCQHCDIAMTYHMRENQLTCHYCGVSEAVPQKCPSCGSGHIRFLGNGTEKIESYLNTYFSSYGIGRMDFDTTSGKDGHQKILDLFKNRAFNILVGTQMIAKGHDFPNVALVGIVAADLSLYMQDFRSEERTYQLLTQALGRAGRGNIPGRVLIQTYNPEHRVLQAIKNNQEQAFYKEELTSRQMMGYPPYSHLLQVWLTGKNEQHVIQTAHMLSHYYKYYNKKKFFHILGPSAAIVGKVADAYRWKLIILGEDRALLMLFAKYVLNKFISRENTDTININWDIDPYTML